MPRWMLIVFVGLMIYVPILPQPTAYAQGNSILVRDEPVYVKKESLLESVFWGSKRHSAPEAEEYGYEIKSSSYGYDHDDYGFRSDDEYGAEEDGRYGYEMNAAQLDDLWSMNN